MSSMKFLARVAKMWIRILIGLAILEGLTKHVALVSFRKVHMAYVHMASSYSGYGNPSADWIKIQIIIERQKWSLSIMIEFTERSRNLLEQDLRPEFAKYSVLKIVEIRCGTHCWWVMKKAEKSLVKRVHCPLFSASLFKREAPSPSHALGYFFRVSHGYYIFWPPLYHWTG